MITKKQLQDAAIQIWGPQTWVMGDYDDDRFRIEITHMDVNFTHLKQLSEMLGTEKIDIGHERGYSWGGDETILIIHRE